MYFDKARAGVAPQKRSFKWWLALLCQYLREPLWALKAAPPRDAAILLKKTVQHHVANWLKLARNDDSAFSLHLNLGAPELSSITLRAVGGDITILYEVFAEQAYLIPEAALPPEDVLTVVDCGSHVGLTALYFAYRYPRARVIAIEPNPTNFRLLVANTAQAPRIVPVRACISDRSGTSHITVDGPGWGHRIGSIGAEVPALTLQDIRDRFGVDTIDLLKMDVEGTEKAVLACNIGNVRAIAAELHGDYTFEQFASDVAPLKVSSRPGRDPVFALGG